MAVSFVNYGTSAESATNSAVPYPASPAAGNAFVLHAGNKAAVPATSIPTVATAGWVARKTLHTGTTASGADVGSVRASAFTLDPAAGSESGNVTTTYNTAAAQSMGRMAQYSKAGGTEWSIDSKILVDTDETGTGVSAVGTGVGITSFINGDHISIGVFIKGDAINHTGQGLAIPGCTLSAITWEAKTTGATGSDMSMYIGRCTVTAGAATGQPTYTATSSLSGASATAVSVVRLREIAASPQTYNDFDHGTNGTAVTVANSDDGGESAVVSVTGTVAYTTDVAEVIRGAASVECTTVASSQSYFQMPLPEIHSDKPWCCRVRLRIPTPANDATGDRFLTIQGDDGGFQAEMRMINGNLIRLLSGPGATQDTSTFAYVAGDVLDIGFKMLSYHLTTGDIEADIIDPFTGTSLETLTSAGSLNTVNGTGGRSVVALGVVRSLATRQTIIDDFIAVRGTTYPSLPNLTAPGVQSMGWGVRMN